MKRMSFSTTSLILAGLILTLGQNAPALEAGAGPQVGRGARVRVMTRNNPGKPVIGTVFAVTSDSLDLTMERGAFLSFRRADISSVELSIGEKRKTKKGAAIGAAIGAGIGLLALNGDEFDYDYYGNPWSDTDVFSSFTFGGAFWGAVLGYRARTDRWMAASLESEDGSDRTAFQGPPVPVTSPPTLVPPSALPHTPLSTGDALSSLYTGSRVRVRHVSGVAEGNVLGLDETTMTIAGQSGVLPIPRSSIVTVESWTGESRRTLRGALIGAVVTAAGDFLGEPECVGYVDDADCSRSRSVAIGAA